MNNRLNFLLRTAISAATEDREAFIDKFSTLLEEYTGLEKEVGKTAGKHLSSGLSALRTELENAAIRKEASENKAGTDELLSQLAKIERKIEELERKIDSRA